MLPQAFWQRRLVTAVLVLAANVQWAAAQTATTTPSAAQPAAQPAPQPSAAQAPADQHAPAVDEGARRAQILSSEPWRRAMYEMNEFLKSQKRYTPEQVVQIKANFSAKVQRMSADQLQFMLNDMDAKLKILATPQAQEARAWLGHYLSILSDQKREEVLRKLPNIEQMTAAQLEQEIAAIDQRRAAAQQQAKQVQQLRDSATNPWNQTAKLAEQSYVRDHSPQSGGYSSPYRAPNNNGKRPFEDYRETPGMGFYVNPYGGVGLFFGHGF